MLAFVVPVTVVGSAGTRALGQEDAAGMIAWRVSSAPGDRAIPAGSGQLTRG